MFDTQEQANALGLDLTAVNRPTLEVGSRVKVDEIGGLGTGTVVAWVDKDTVDSSIDPEEDWLLVKLDDGVWGWKGSSFSTEGEQGIAYFGVIVVSISNLICID